MDERIASLAKTVIAAVSLVFAVFFFLEARHVLRSEAEAEAAAVRERILMAESARYAEIASYYTLKLKSGDKLSEAEQARLELVQQQQIRINDTLAKGK
jgi:Na+/H+ antiporter NhaC